MDLAGMISMVASVVIISMSGVLMPGPITAVTMASGSHSPHAGAWVSIGHGVVEFPLMALIYFGAGALFQLAAAKVVIGSVGGLFLLWMGVSMLRDYKKVESPGEGIEAPGSARSPFAAGMLLSVGNPYFLVWWATVGATLVSELTLKFGVIGFVVLAIAHWLCDFVWYYFLSALSFGGRRFFGRKLQQAVFVACGLALLYFALYFLWNAASTVHELV